MIGTPTRHYTNPFKTYTEVTCSELRERLLDEKAKHANSGGRVDQAMSARLG